MKTMADISAFESLGTTSVSVQNVGFEDLYGAKKRDKLRKLLWGAMLGTVGAGALAGALGYRAGQAPEKIPYNGPKAEVVQDAAKTFHDKANEYMTKGGDFLTRYAQEH